MPPTFEEVGLIEEFAKLGYPYKDDGKSCPECDIPLTRNYHEDIAYCLNCNFTIYKYSEV